MNTDIYKNVLWRSFCVSLIIGLSFPFGIFGTAQAAVPRVVNYQSRLRDVSLNPITASTNIQYTLYNHASNGSFGDVESASGPVLWKEVHDGVSCPAITPDVDGYFAVQLGACVAFPAYIDFNDPLYLGVRIGADAEAAPRVLFAASPYTLNAETVDTLHATSTATANQLLALDDELNFNISTGTFYGGGLLVNGSSTLQNLNFTVATGTSLELNSYLSIGAIRLDAVGTSNVSSGAYLVGVFDEFANSNATTVQGALRDFDLGLTAVSSSLNGFDLQAVTDKGSTTTNSIEFNGAVSTGDITINRPAAAAMFTVNSGSDDAYLYLIGNGSATEIMLSGNGGGTWAQIETNADGSMQFLANAHQSLFLDGSSGNVGIGNMGADLFRLQVAGNVGPGAHNTYDLGSATSSWRNIYAGLVTTTELYVNGQQVFGGSPTLDAAYDGGGSGAGRFIIADSGPITITGLTYTQGALNITNTTDSQAVYVNNTGVGNAFSARNMDAGSGFYSRNQGTGPGVRIDNNSNSARGLYIENVMNGTGGYVANTGGGDGFTIEHSGNRTGLRINNTGVGRGAYVRNDTGTGFEIDNYSDTYYGLHVHNRSTGYGMYVESAGGSGIYIDDTGSKAGLKVNTIAGTANMLELTNGDDARPIYITHAGTQEGFWMRNTGTGASLWIEDAGSDFSPFVLDADGRMGVSASNTANFMLTVGGSAGPSVHNTFDLGSPTTSWRNIYSQGFVSTTALYVNGQLIPTSTGSLQAAYDAGRTINTVDGSTPVEIINPGTSQWETAFALTNAGNGGGIAMQTMESSGDYGGRIYLTNDTSDPQNGTGAYMYTDNTMEAFEFGYQRAGVRGSSFYIDNNQMALSVPGTPNNGALRVMAGNWNIPVLTLAAAGNNNTVQFSVGTSTPEGKVIADSGSVYQRVDGVGGTQQMYLKLTDGGTTGWAPVLTASSTLNEADTLQTVTNRGNSTTNTIQFAGGTSTGSLNPSATNSLSLGSSSTRWSDVWTANLHIGSSTWDFGQATNGAFTISRDGIETTRIATNGNFGIGTNNPSNALHVVGSARATTGFSANNGTSGSPSFYFTSDADTGMFSPSANILALATGGGERLRIDASGNLGVGTSTPGYRLDVVGDARISSQLMLGRYAALPASGFQSGSMIYSTASSTPYFWNGTRWVAFATGTTLLPGSFTLQVAADNSIAKDGYVFYDTGAAKYDDDGGMMNIIAKPEGRMIGLAEDGGSRLYFKSDSGPTDPAKISFIDARVATDTRGIEYDGDYSAGFSSRSLVDKGFVVNYVASSTGALNLQQVTNNGKVTTNSIQFAGGTSTGQFVVNGRLGINTNNPNYALDVHSDSDVLAIWLNSLGEGVAITNDYLGGEIGLLDARTDRIIAAASKSNVDLFHFGGRVLNVNADNFRVGVNTTTPSSLFEIQGGLVGDAILTVDSDDGALDGRDAGIVINSDNGNGSDAAFIKFNNNGTPGGKLYSGLYESGFNVEGDRSFLFRTNNLDRLNIGGDGRIGISTTTPEAIVSIDGSVIGGNRMLEVSNQDDRRGVGFGIDAYGGDLGLYYDRGNHLLATTYMGGGGGYDYVFLGDRHLTVRQASGFVGVGTEEPANRLHVMGGISIASSTPATSSQALYNLGGILYWNGVPLGSASSVNIYNSDGSIAATRNVTIANGRELRFADQENPGNYVFLKTDYNANGNLRIGGMNDNEGGSESYISFMDNMNFYATNGMDFDASSNQIDLRGSNGVLSIGGGNLFTDLGAAGSRYGLRYESDYSADFVARSLVDKGFVVNYVASSTGAMNLQRVTNNGNSTTNTIQFAGGTSTSPFVVYDTNNPTQRPSLDVYTNQSGNIFRAANSDDVSGVGIGVDMYGGDLGLNYENGNHLMVSTYFGGGANYDYVFLGDRHLTVRQASGFIGIGTESPSNRLDVMGAISIASSTPATSTYALYNLGGELYWNGIPISSASSLVDNDGDTKIEVEASPDEDFIRLSTSGTQRMYIRNDGRIGIGTDSALVSLLTVGPGTHEASTFSVSGMDGMVNIANFRDKNGENVFRASGSVADGDLVVGFGDIDYGGNGTGIKVDYASNSIKLSNSQLRFYENASTGDYVGFIAPASLTTSTVWTLPSADGTSGQVLSTNGLGILSWATSSDLSANIYNTDGNIPETRSVTVENGNELRFLDQDNAGNYIYLQTDYNTNGNLKIGGRNNDEGSTDHYIEFMDNLNLHSTHGVDIDASTSQVDLRGSDSVLSVGGGSYFNDLRAAGSRYGLRYWSDYSADFVDRSLVDKGFVVNYVASSTGALTLQQVTNNGNSTTNTIQFAGGTSTSDFILSRPTAAANLTVNSGNDDAFFTLSGNGGASTLRMSSNAGGNWATIETASNGSFNLVADGKGVLWADGPTGFLGVGTNSPQSLLNVHSDSQTSELRVSSDGGQSAYVIVDFDKAGGGEGSLSFRENGVQKGVINSGTNGYDFFGIAGDSGAALDLFTNGLVRLHVATSTGAVGIGSTDPTARLHVTSGAASTTAVMTVQSNAGDFQIFDVAASPEGAVTASRGDLAVDSSNGRMYIKETGAGTNTGWSAFATGTVAQHWQKNTNVLSPADSGVYQISVTNNSANTLTGFKAVNTNDTSNYAGAVIEMKGSGADYTNNMYFGKYGAGFWIPSWAGNGVLATDKNLVVSAVGNTSTIAFQVGGGYSAPVSRMTLDSDSLDVLQGMKVDFVTTGVSAQTASMQQVIGGNFEGLQLSVPNSAAGHTPFVGFNLGTASRGFLFGSYSNNGVMRINDYNFANLQNNVSHLDISQTMNTGVFISATATNPSIHLSHLYGSNAGVKLYTRDSSDDNGYSQDLVLSLSQIGAGSFTDRYKFTYDGRLGVNTMNPANALHVNGGISISSSTPMTTSTALYNLGNTLYWNGWQVATGTGSLTLQQVTNNGNTTTNAIQFAGGTSTGNFNPSVTNGLSLGSTGNRWSDVWTANLHLGTSTWDLGQSASGGLVFNTSASEKARLTSAGNLGIGEAAPTRRLEIVGSSTAADDLFKVSGGSNNGFLSIYMEPTDDRNTKVEFMRDLAFASNGFGSSMLRLTDDAVGINTDNPTQALSVVGDAVIGQYDSGILPIGGTDHSLYVNAVDGQMVGTQGTASLVMTRNTALLGRLNLSTQNNLLLQNYVGGAWNTGLTVSPNGNVGVGALASAPDSKLTVFATGTHAATFRLFNDSIANFKISAADGLTTVNFDEIGDGNELQFASELSGVMRLTRNRVGIGNTSPSTTFHVVGTSTLQNVVPQTGLSYDFGSAASRWNNAWISSLHLGTSTWDLSQASNGALTIGQYLGTEAMRIATNGNVGIGTNNPSNALHVVGSARATSGFSANAGTAGSPAYYYTSDSDTGVFNPAANSLALTTGGTERLRINSSGNVGIGTSAPGSKLEISADNSLANASLLKFQASNNSDIQSEIYFSGGGNATYWNVDSSGAGGALIVMNGSTEIGKFVNNGIVINEGGAANVDFRVESDTSTHAFFVDATNGNSGFDQSAPLARLHVGNATAGATANYDFMRLQATGDVDHSLYLPVGSNLMVWDYNTTGNGGAIEFRNYGSRVGMFTNTGLVVNDGGVTGIGLRVEGDTNANLLYTDAANDRIGVGTSTPAVRLHVTQSGNTVAAFDRSTNDGTVISIRQDSTEEGTISVSGNTVSYNAFTGSHYAWTSSAIEKGMLVSLTGVNRRLHDNPSSEILYGIEKTVQANDDRVMGAYLSLLNSADAPSADNPHLVMAVGNGEVWVVEGASDVKAGDYLVSSDVAGHAVLDSRSADKSYVVARAAEDVKWSEVTETVDGRKHKSVSVFFESFVRDNSTGALLQGQQAGEQLPASSAVVVRDDYEFRGRVVVQGHVAFGGDSVGQAKILSGQKEVRVIFDQEYAVQPIVTVTPLDFIDTMYRVTDVNTKGFIIQLNSQQGNDKLFNWHAFGSADGKVFVSDGTTSTVQVIVTDDFLPLGYAPAASPDAGTAVPDEPATETPGEAASGTPATEPTAETVPQTAETIPQTTEPASSEPVVQADESGTPSGSGSTSAPEQASAPAPAVPEPAEAAPVEVGTVTP